jgi:ubiquinone biosynthesis protein
MKISLKPQHIKRYREIVSLMVRYGFREWVKSTGLKELIGNGDLAEDAPASKRPEEFARELEKMGPTFVKLGQMLSTRGDLVPAEYIPALERLQNDVPPFSFEELEQVILEEFGRPVSKAFLTFEPTPLAAASLGQVHKAQLHDGRVVAVKIQRPGIRAKLAEDLDVLDEMASTLESVAHIAQRYRLKSLIEEFRRTLMRELDYVKEADNLTLLATNLAGFKEIVVPLPVRDYSTARVLTMDYIDGRKITDITDADRARINGKHFAEVLQKAYMKQICIDGFFHADPHPGNIVLTKDDRIGLLDLGMVGLINPALREKLLRLLIALGEGRPQMAADLAVQIGEPAENFNEPEFRVRIQELVNAYQGASISGIQLGKVVIEIARTSADNGVRPPSQITMVGKALMNLDEIGTSLAPDFDPYETIRHGAIPLVLKMIANSASSASVLSRMLEANEFVNELPGRVNKILDRVAENRVEVRVRWVDEFELVDGFQKVANRIAEGLVIAALIVGASNLMNIETDFRILGYPGFAIICFLLALVGGGILIYSIYRHDRAPPKK